MKPKKKICKGNYRSEKGFGCGELKYLHKYNLCLSCFRKWLYSTESGQKHLKKQVIPQAKKDVKRKDKKLIKELKQKLKTHKDYLSDLQKVFNKWIRLRDQNEPCISCGTKSQNIQYAAGHYYPMGNYSFLRFHEWNVHKQCNKKCNMMMSGNLIEYRKNLVKKIGKENLKWLDDNRHNQLKLSIPEIKELIINYKNKIKHYES